MLRPRGYLVLFGGASGAIPPFDLLELQTRVALRHASQPATLHRYPRRTGAAFRRCIQMILSGKMKLRIHKTYPLAEAQQAHRDLEGRKTTGKTLLIL